MSNNSWVNGYAAGKQSLQAELDWYKDEVKRLKAISIYTCTDHDGHYPVGVASVVVANSESDAKILLSAELNSHSLDGSKTFTLRRINTDTPKAFVLRDGDY